MILARSSKILSMILNHLQKRRKWRSSSLQMGNILQRRILLSRMCSQICCPMLLNTVPKAAKWLSIFKTLPPTGEFRSLILDSGSQKKTNQNCSSASSVWIKRESKERDLGLQLSSGSLNFMAGMWVLRIILRVREVCFG